MNKVRHWFIVFLSVCLFSEAFASSKSDNPIKVFQTLGEGWELFMEKTPQEVFKLADSNSPSDFTVTVPHTWNREAKRIGSKTTNTYGCYRYVLEDLNPNIEYALHMKESPGTACAIYVNRKLITQIGDPFEMLEKDFDQNPRHYNESYSQSIPVYCNFTPDSNGAAEVVILVSNYYYRIGGLWDIVYLGKAELLWRYYIITLVFYCVVIGSLLFIGLLNFFQFALNKKRLEYFYLALASVACALRIGTAGYCSLGILIPSLTAELKVKFEILAMWLVPVAIMQLIFLIYPSNNRTLVFKFLKEKYLRGILITIALATGIYSLVMPAYYSNRMVPFFQGLLIVFSVYVIIFSISNLIKHKRYSLYNFLSFSTIVVGSIIDIIHSNSKETIPVPTLPFFILTFVIIQIIMLAAIQNDIYKETVKASDDLTRLNNAYLRFVPKEFLKLLNKESIIKTKLGDYSNIEMTIIYSKVSIVSTNNSELLDENFLIFSEYLKAVSSVIKKYDGFVSKFLSGGFMALFPNSELDAIRAALEIKHCIKELNESEICKNHTVIPWMGIHYGKMIIGTIGEENRMDDTVISDTVNTSSRIENVCEQIEKNIIISEAIYKRVSEEKISNINFNPLEAIYVKGKEKPLLLYEVSRRKQTAAESQEESK